VTAYTLTYGPVFSYRRWDRLVHMRRCKPARFTEIKLSRNFQDAFKLALAGGGGVDFSINRKLQYESRANTCSLDSSASTRIICKHRLVWFTGLGHK